MVIPCLSLLILIEHMLLEQLLLKWVTEAELFE
jgi:hypothetical protein